MKPDVGLPPDVSYDYLPLTSLAEMGGQRVQAASAGTRYGLAHPAGTVRGCDGGRRLAVSTAAPKHCRRTNAHRRAADPELHVAGGRRFAHDRRADRMRRHPRPATKVDPLLRHL